MKSYKLRNILLSISFIYIFTANAQYQTIDVKADSMKMQMEDAMLFVTDSVTNKNSTIDTKTDSIATILPLQNDAIADATNQQNLVKKDNIIIPFKPNPNKAILYSAIFPGLGQIYNRKYWKLPIIYGGFVGVAYATTWNNGYYKGYFNAYKDIIDSDDNTNSWHEYIPYGKTPNNVDKNWLKNTLKDRKDFYRYYRDFSIIIGIALYGLVIIDAYVDAQLYEFDISPDLSMKVEPIIMNNKLNSSNNLSSTYLANSVGVKWSFNF